MTLYSNTNTEKKRKEGDLLRGAHPKVKHHILSTKEKPFYSEDGEDLSDQFELVARSTEGQRRALQSNDIMENHAIENGRFVIAFFERNKLLTERFPTLSAQDIARLMYLATFVAYKTNRLQSDNGKKVYRKSDLEELVDMSAKRFNELFKRYKNEGVLLESDKGEFFIDPTVVYRGRIKELRGIADNFDHTRIFRKTVRELYQQFKGRKLGQLALVYSVMPFLNFKTNVICFNPEETAADMVKPINIKTLCDILGYSDTTKLKRSLKNVQVNGDRVFNFAEDVEDSRQRIIYVNPKVIYGGDGESLEALKPMFNSSK